MKVITFIISFLCLFSNKDLISTFLNSEITINEKKHLSTIILDEKITFEYTLKTLKGYGNLQKDGLIIYSGTKLISNQEFKNLEKKYSKANTKKWSETDFKKLNLRVCALDSLNMIIQSGKEVKPSYVYCFSDVFVTSDNKYKFYYVMKSLSNEIGSPIYANIYLYKRSNKKWEIVEKIPTQSLY